MNTFPLGVAAKASYARRSGGGIIVANLVADPATVQAPGVYQIISANLVSNAATVYQPSASQSLFIFMNVLNAPASILTPTVAPGSVTVVANLVSDSATVNSPAVAHMVAANLVTASASVLTPTVVPGSVTAVATLVSDPAVVNQPSVSRTAGALEGAALNLAYLYSNTLVIDPDNRVVASDLAILSLVELVES